MVAGPKPLHWARSRASRLDASAAAASGSRDADVAARPGCSNRALGGMGSRHWNRRRRRSVGPGYPGCTASALLAAWPHAETTARWPGGSKTPQFRLKPVQRCERSLGISIRSGRSLWLGTLLQGAVLGGDTFDVLPAIV